MIFSKIHSFSKPVPLPPVRKWQTDLPETRKCAVSPTKIFTNSLFGLCMHWIGSGSKQHKKRRGKLVLMGPSDAAGGPRWLASAAEELTPLPLSRYTTLSSASRRAVCPPRAPRRARFPRPPSWRLFLSLAGKL